MWLTPTYKTIGNNKTYNVSIPHHLGTHSVDNVLVASIEDKNGEGNCFHFIMPGITSYTTNDNSIYSLSIHFNLMIKFLLGTFSWIFGDG